MSDHDVNILLKFLPIYKEIDVFEETYVSLVEKHLLLHMGCQASKGLVIEEIVEDDVVSAPVKRTKESYCC